MKLKITVHGVAYEVDVEVLDAGSGFPPACASPLPHVNGGAASSAALAEPHASRKSPGQPSFPDSDSAGAGSITSPIAGTVLEVKCRSGQEVSKGQDLIIVEAMKMEASITAPVAGRIKSVEVAVGDAVRESQVVAQYM
ncbi:MAG: biotin/lipoyl-containing protein [Planctomycetota bacterium]